MKGKANTIWFNLAVVSHYGSTDWINWLWNLSITEWLRLEGSLLLRQGHPEQDAQACPGPGQAAFEDPHGGGSTDSLRDLCFIILLLGSVSLCSNTAHHLSAGLVVGMYIRYSSTLVSFIAVSKVLGYQYRYSCHSSTLLWCFNTSIFTHITFISLSIVLLLTSTHWDWKAADSSAIHMSLSDLLLWLMYTSFLLCRLLTWKNELWMSSF